MGKINEDKIKSWEELSHSIVGIYLKLIEFERKNDLGDNYKNLLYLLPTALRLEKEKFLNMGLNESNYRQLSIRFNISDITVTEATEGNNEAFSKMRKNNYFTSMLNFTYNGFYKLKQTFGIQSFVENKNELSRIQDEIFSEIYHTQVTVNYVQMIKSYIDTVEDDDVRDYLIYLKYLMIGTVPQYEEDFALFGGKILPTREIISTFPMIDGYTENDIKTLVENSLKRDILEELEIMSRINNFIFPYHLKLVYKELALNKARLISLNSESFINSIQTEIDKILLKGNSFYSEINRLILDIFDEARDFIKTQDKKKKALK